MPVKASAEKGELILKIYKYLVTCNFLIETYSFFEKQNPTTTLLIKSLSKLSKESLHLFTEFSLSSTGSFFQYLIHCRVPDKEWSFQDGGL
jgi:hypothetical protein